jgi:hypothetical protein
MRQIEAIGFGQLAVSTTELRAFGRSSLKTTIRFAVKRWARAAAQVESQRRIEREGKREYPLEDGILSFSSGSGPRLYLTGPFRKNSEGMGQFGHVYSTFLARRHRGRVWRFLIPLALMFRSSFLVILPQRRSAKKCKNAGGREERRQGSYNGQASGTVWHGQRPVF